MPSFVGSPLIRRPFVAMFFIFMAILPQHASNRLDVSCWKKSNARDAAIPGFGLLFASVVTLSLGVLLLLSHYLF